MEVQTSQEVILHEMTTARCVRDLAWDGYSKTKIQARGADDHRGPGPRHQIVKLSKVMEGRPGNEPRTLGGLRKISLIETRKLAC